MFQGDRDGTEGEERQCGQDDCGVYEGGQEVGENPQCIHFCNNSCLDADIGELVQMGVFSDGSDEDVVAWDDIRARQLMHSITSPNSPMKPRHLGLHFEPQEMSDDNRCVDLSASVPAVVADVVYSQERASASATAVVVDVVRPQVRASATATAVVVDVVNSQVIVSASATAAVADVAKVRPSFIIWEAKHIEERNNVVVRRLILPAKLRLYVYWGEFDVRIRNALSFYLIGDKSPSTT